MKLSGDARRSVRAYVCPEMSPETNGWAQKRQFCAHICTSAKYGCLLTLSEIFNVLDLQLQYHGFKLGSSYVNISYTATVGANIAISNAYEVACDLLIDKFKCVFGPF